MSAPSSPLPPVAAPRRRARARWTWLGVWLLGLVACSPLTFPPPPTPAPSAIPSLPAATFTPLPTLTPVPSASATPQPSPSVSVQSAEPAGCLSAAQQAGRSTTEMLAYADRLLALDVPLARRELISAWNATRDAYLPTGEDVLAFSTVNVQNRYTIQSMLDVLHVAGFATWLRNDSLEGEHILAVPLRAGVLDGDWAEYVRAYFAGSREQPAGDPNVLETLKLTPCRWMVTTGLSPDLPAGSLEEASWEQPDFAAAAQGFLAPGNEEAYAVAQRIAWLDGMSESPALMCGPLTWAITNAAGAFPPGYGAWYGAPKSFWLPKPSENGRPWSLFPPETYQVTRYAQSLASVDLDQAPLEAGDLLYTYSGGDGFDHLLVVSESDADGNRFAVTNLVQATPQVQYSIQRVLLYKAGDPAAGILQHQWATDRVNGRTGDKGFEVFRWAWRQKDISGLAAQYRVQPGDSLPLVAARWRTPPEQIVAANGLDPASPLQLGQVLTIPPNAQ
jgi:hypothetical protein